VNSCRNVRDYKIGVVSDRTHQTFTSKELELQANPNPACSNCGGETIEWDRSCPVCGWPMKSGNARVMFD